MLELRRELGDRFEHFQSLDSFEKSSYVLGSEAWEEYSSGLLGLIKDFVLSVWEERKVRLYGEHANVHQSHSQNDSGDLRGIAGGDGELGCLCGKADTSHLCDGSAHSSGCVVNGYGCRLSYYYYLQHTTAPHAHNAYSGVRSILNNLNSTCMQDVYHWWISGLNHVSIGWPRPLWTFTSPVHYSRCPQELWTHHSILFINGQHSLLGEVKHRNTVIIVCTCVLQCIGVDVYTYRIAMYLIYPMPRPCTLYTNIH